MVDRRYFTRYLPVSLNNLRYDGRVPSEGESLERRHDRRVLGSRCNRCTGALDANESARLIILVRLKKNESLVKYSGRHFPRRRHRLSNFPGRSGRYAYGWI